MNICLLKSEFVTDMLFIVLELLKTEENIKMSTINVTDENKNEILSHQVGRNYK